VRVVRHNSREWAWQSRAQQRSDGHVEGGRFDCAEGEEEEVLEENGLRGEEI
jgi:hypothetical protein